MQIIQSFLSEAFFLFLVLTKNKKSKTMKNTEIYLVKNSSMKRSIAIAFISNSHEICSLNNRNIQNLLKERNLSPIHQQGNIHSTGYHCWSFTGFVEESELNEIVRDIVRRRDQELEFLEENNQFVQDYNDDTPDFDSQLIAFYGENY